jgi:hypothetical protein
MKRSLFLLLGSLVVLAVLSGGCCSRCCSKGAATLELFDGKSLDGWQHVLADSSVKKEDVWSVKDGILTCKGTPVGAIYRGPDVKNFKLVVEYRWAPGEKPGNSGIFSRIHGSIQPLPPCVEVQLQHGNAGDVLGLQGSEVASGQPRFFEVKKHVLAGDVAGVKKLSDAEKPAGEWNRVEITAKEDVYRVVMNGTLINEVPGVGQHAGPVGLQSEGGVIQFRRASLTPMD